jgi:hypothetical protein
MMLARTAFLFLAAVPATTASAGPLEDRAVSEVNIETASTSAPNGGVGEGAGTVQSTVTTDREGATQSGNPLWMVPLSALRATRDRPLFAASRRPPIAPTAAPPPPPSVVRAVPDPPEAPPLMLVGTIVNSEASIALVRNPAAEAIVRLRVGEENLGWRLRSVAIRSIVIEKGTRSLTLELPAPHD